LRQQKRIGIADDPSHKKWPRFSAYPIKAQVKRLDILQKFQMTERKRAADHESDALVTLHYDFSTYVPGENRLDGWTIAQSHENTFGLNQAFECRSG